MGICLIEYVSLSDRLSTPNKLMESLMAGIPPLCSDIPEARRLLGPERATTWILDSPAEQIHSALERITAEDVAEFRMHWEGIPAWDVQAAQLVEAYRDAIEGKPNGRD